MAKFNLFILGLALFIELPAFAAPLQINLTEQDQARLTKDLSKIDLAYRTEEILQETPYRIVRKTYRFLDESKAFFMKCSEDFAHFATVGQNAQCDVVVDDALSQTDFLEVRDGFMPELAIVEVKDVAIARVLYKTIGNGTSPKVSFSTLEQSSLLHPSAGTHFNAFRLRIECERNAAYDAFHCSVAAVK